MSITPNLGRDHDDLAGGFDDDLVNGGPGDDTLAGELPGGGGVPAEEARKDRCIGASGNDTAIECDKTTGVEG